MDSDTRSALAPVAKAVKPLLNRLVFHGIGVCRGLLDDPTVRVRSVGGVPSRIRVLATVAVDRIASELVAAGLRRVLRTATQEDWVFGETLTLQIEPSDTGDGADTADAVAREYAVLLTRAMSVSEDCSVRVPGLPAQLALLWSSHLATLCATTDSAAVEDMIEIVMRRRMIVDDVLGAPEELRCIVARAARAFVADESSIWALRRALPDARLAPGVAARACERFKRLAELGCD